MCKIVNNHFYATEQMRDFEIESGNYNDSKQSIDLLRRDWLSKSLHEDEYLKESAQIVLKTSIACDEPGDTRPILIYDPQGLGKTWLRNILKAKIQMSTLWSVHFYNAFSPQRDIVAVCQSDYELGKIANAARQKGQVVFIDELNSTFSPAVARLLKSLNSGTLNTLRKTPILFNILIL